MATYIRKNTTCHNYELDFHDDEELKFYTSHLKTNDNAIFTAPKIEIVNSSIQARELTFDSKDFICKNSKIVAQNIYLPHAEDECDLHHCKFIGHVHDLSSIQE